jgi:tyrosine-protein kinase Etk/Wzc
MTSQLQTNADDSDEIDLGRIVLLLWGEKFTIGLFVLIGLALGMMNYANSTPTFQADALLQLEERRGTLALPEGLDKLIENDPRTETEIQILKSRFVMGDVVASLNLDWMVLPKKAPLIGTMLQRYNLPVPNFVFMRPFVRPGESLTLTLLQVPPRWVGQGIALEVTGPDSYSIVTPDGKTLTGTVGMTLRDVEAGFALEVETLKAPAGREYTLLQMSELAAISALRGNLGVGEQGRGSSILQISFTGTDRDKVRTTLDAIATTYLRQNIERSAAEADSSLAFLEQQLPEARAAVAQAEAALNAYRQEQEAIDLSFETEALLTQVTALEAQLSDLQVQEDEVKRRYTPSHPVYQQLLAQRARLEERLGQLRTEVAALPEQQREIVNLTRNLELAMAVQTQLLTRTQEVRVLRASTIGNVRIIDDAATAQFAVSPNRNRLILLHIIMGLAVGVGFVFLRGWMRKGIQGSEVLEANGIPVFATINLSAEQIAKSTSRTASDILALSSPTDLAVEGIRSLRTSLHFGMLDSDRKSIAVTSAAPSAGKSFTSTNLAVVMAQSGQRVCLVDGDMRRGQVRKFFGIDKKSPGLSSYLSEEANLEAVVYPTKVDGLFVIPSGYYPPNPSELLMRKSLRDLSAVLDENFDLVIFDCPPVLAVTDPVVIAGIAGTTILVVRYDETPLSEVQAVKRIFETSGLKIAGSIFNGFDPNKAKADGYSYSYNYRYDYRTRGK